MPLIPGENAPGGNWVGVYLLFLRKEDSTDKRDWMAGLLPPGAWIGQSDERVNTPTRQTNYLGDDPFASSVHFFLYYKESDALAKKKKTDRPETRRNVTLSPGNAEPLPGRG